MLVASARRLTNPARKSRVGARRNPSQTLAGVFLAHGACDVPHFRGDALRDPRVHAYAARIRHEPDGNTDENALDPQRFVARLQSGAVHEIVVPHAYGHPKAPLTDFENDQKFLGCWGHAGLPGERAQRVLDAVRNVEGLPDMAALPALLTGRD
ncbi:MmgE/PrpD family protein [Leptolyngbya sp. 15MV]|nr:MmgE/PrpD family protein [Leptolyngbya sp. 15MV]